MREIDLTMAAKAVHRAVVELRGANEDGYCFDYAMIGSAMITKLTDQLHVPQVGTLRVLADPDTSGWICHEVGAYSDPMAALDAGEFHAWLGGPMGIIDFSARHYKSVKCDLTLAGVEYVQWNRPDPPLYVHVPPGELYPEWVHYLPDPTLTTVVFERGPEMFATYRDSVRFALEAYRIASESAIREKDEKAARAKKKSERQARRRGRAR